MRVRKFAASMTIGLILGAAVGASAAYIGKAKWDEGAGTPIAQAFHLGYVAGVVDTAQALKSASYLSRQTIAEALDTVNQCTQYLSLGQVTQRTEAAILNSQSTDNVAGAILVDLVGCR